MTGEDRASSPAVVAIIGGASSVVCLLPVFLTGSLATFIQDDLSLSAAGLGIAVALFRAAGAASSPFLGRSADRLGATLSLRIATATAVVASLGIALTAKSTAILIAWLMLAGCSVALVQPAANRLLAAGVSASGLGRAFGIKQSAPPLASMLGGLSVPVIAVTVGWRWSFGVAAGLAALMTILVRPTRRAVDRRSTTTVVSPPTDRGTVVMLAVAFGLGTSCSSAVTTFFVVAVVGRGTSDVMAGTLLGIAGLLAVATRIVAGILADRFPANHLRGCAYLAGFGALGVGVLSFAGSVALQGVAVMVALVGTWGFNGVFWFALIKAFPEAPGRITGAVAPGALIGSTIGPIAFGLVAEAAGYGLAFRLAAIVALATAVALLIGNSRIRSLGEPAY